jgi:hypothetical protein
MTHKKICKLAECGKEFETKAHNAEYCSESHKFKDYRRNNPRKKQLGSVQNGVLAMAKATPIQRPQLDPLGDFMVRSVERERDKLDTELTDLKKKYEALKEKKIELEKQLENANRAIEEKPRGLSGLVQSNPDFLNKALELGMPLINQLVDKVMNSTPPQNQLAAPDQNANPVWMWLVAQPKEIIDQFVMLLEKLDGLEKQEKKKDYLEAWNRSLMSVRKTSATVSATATHR